MAVFKWVEMDRGLGRCPRYGRRTAERGGFIEFNFLLLPMKLREMILGLVVLSAGGVWGQEYVVDGVPTVREEEVRWLVNRGRFDAAAENVLRQSGFTDVPARSGPLAPHGSLSRAAQRHSTDMAAKNVMQHETVPGSAFYDPVTQPDPWDRMVAEGYQWNRAAENVAAGYTTAEQVYVGWWKSQGHRRNMYNAELREIGTGYAFGATSIYKHYETMNLGSSGTSAFFTDTVFSDANGNGAYTQGEGVGGVVVVLGVAGVAHPAWDRSTAVGSFAVPLLNIPAGTAVRVGFRNETGAAVTLSLPRSHSALDKLVLPPGETRDYGTFTRTATGRNFGLREVAPLPAAVPDPRLVITVAGADVVLSWSSAVGWNYRVQRSADLDTWANLTTAPMAGTGGTLRHVHSGAVGQTGGFYRLLLEPSS
jgi:hypothetical protein